MTMNVSSIDYTTIQNIVSKYGIYLTKPLEIELNRGNYSFLLVIDTITNCPNFRSVKLFKRVKKHYIQIKQYYYNIPYRWLY